MTSLTESASASAQATATANTKISNMNSSSRMSSSSLIDEEEEEEEEEEEVEEEEITDLDDSVAAANADFARKNLTNDSDEISSDESFLNNQANESISS